MRRSCGSRPRSGKNTSTSECSGCCPFNVWLLTTCSSNESSDCKAAQLHDSGRRGHVAAVLACSHSGSRIGVNMQSDTLLLCRALDAERKDAAAARGAALWSGAMR